MSMTNWRRELGLCRLLPCCARRRTKSGLKIVEMLQGNFLWKEDGCRTDSSTLVGRMKVNAKLATQRKAQKSTDSTNAQNGTK